MTGLSFLRINNVLVLKTETRVQKCIDVKKISKLT
jgi:hypothetical protein